MSKRYSELFGTKEDFEKCQERLVKETKKLNSMNRNEMLIRIGGTVLFVLGALALGTQTIPEEQLTKVGEFLQNNHDIVQKVSYSSLIIGAVVTVGDIIIGKVTNRFQKQFDQSLLVDNLNRIVLENQPKPS